MEDDLKILKVEFLRNHIMDHTQILNLNLDEQTIFYNLQWKMTSHGRGPPMEEDLKILKAEFLSNHLLDHI